MLFYFNDQSRRYGPPLTLRWGTCLDSHCFFGVPAFVVFESASGANISTAK